MACQELTLADTSLTRLFGLLGRSSLPAGQGLLIRPSSGVHTFAMRFAIDVVALDRRDRVRALWHAVPPWRLTAISFLTHSVLELAAGEAERAGIALGDHLAVEPAAPYWSVPSSA